MRSAKSSDTLAGLKTTGLQAQASGRLLNGLWRRAVATAAQQRTPKREAPGDEQGGGALQLWRDRVVRAGR